MQIKKFWNHSKQHSSKTVLLKLWLDLLFWNHSKQHSSKTAFSIAGNRRGFGTIRNNIALKHKGGAMYGNLGFGTIRNNIALKPIASSVCIDVSFGTIRNNIALKQKHDGVYMWRCFGTIRNNIALKPVSVNEKFAFRFWNHSKQHSSKT